VFRQGKYSRFRRSALPRDGNGGRPVAVKQVTLEEATKLLEQGYVYVDVRSEQEFEQGHPAGAFNVPISLVTPMGTVPNTEFLAVMERAFGKDAKLVLGCKSGPRSRRAALQLEQAGFSEFCEMPAGWSGTRDAFGRPQPGWGSSGLPAETGLPEGRNYEGVKQRTPG
jgi:rhodanese-related sulfurtransferase